MDSSVSIQTLERIHVMMKIGEAEVEWINGKYRRYMKIHKKDRWLNISEAAWLKMIDNSKVVEDLMASEDGGIFGFADNGDLEVKDYRGRRYAGLKFQRCGKDDKVYINRMNFNLDEWKELSNFVDETLMMKTKKRKRMTIKKTSKKSKKTIIQYTWQSDKTAMEGTVTSPYWFFSEELCRNNVAILEDDNLVIVTREVPLPPLDDIVTLLTTFLIAKAIRAKMAENCNGCKIDHPSQLQHMSDGCLSEWDESVERYFDAVALTKECVMEACEKILRYLPYTADEVEVKELQKEAAIQYQIPDDFDNLFRDVL